MQKADFGFADTEHGQIADRGRRRRRLVATVPARTLLVKTLFVRAERQQTFN